MHMPSALGPKVSTVILTFLLVMAGSSSTIATDFTSWLSPHQLDATVGQVDSRPATSLAAAGAMPVPTQADHSCTTQVLRTENSPGADLHSGNGAVTTLRTENGPGALIKFTSC